jgi:chromosome segregation ATPase
MVNLNGGKIKSLQVQITKIEEEIKNYNLQLQNIHLDITTKQQQIQKYQEELKKLKTSNDIIISEHAILRYIERVMKIDMVKLHSEIISKDFQNTLKNLGNGTYPYKNHLIKVVDNVVVTVTAKEDALQSNPKTQPKKSQIKMKLHNQPQMKKRKDYSHELLEDYLDGEV